MGHFSQTAQALIVLTIVTQISGNRLRHNTEAASNTLSDNDLLSHIQSDILSSLGMNEAPRISADIIPEEARQVLIQDAQLESNTDKHFMEDQSSVLLLARKGRHPYLIRNCT